MEQIIDISVIIPIYNGSKYIKTIVATLEQQSYRSFEAIFIDDGSKDDSVIKLKETLEHATFQYQIIHQENSGVSAARNAGIRASRTRYIAFVDVDDELHPAYLQKLHEQMESSQMVVGCGLTDTYQELENRNIQSITYNKLDALHAFLVGEFQIGVCGLLIPRSILLDNQLLFAEGYKYSEDLHMVWRILSHINNIKIIDFPMYIYNKNQGSAMTKIGAARIDSMTLMKQLESYFADNCQEFYPEFKKYGVARIAWSTLWQIAHYTTYKGFLESIKSYDYGTEMRKLWDFSDKKVSISARVFNVSKLLYFLCAKIATKNYRR